MNNILFEFYWKNIMEIQNTGKVKYCLMRKRQIVDFFSSAKEAWYHIWVFKSIFQDIKVNEYSVVEITADDSLSFFIKNCI